MTDRQTDGQTDGQTERRTDRQTDKQTDICDCRVAFATENSQTKSEYHQIYAIIEYGTYEHMNWPIMV